MDIARTIIGASILTLVPGCLALQQAAAQDHAEAPVYFIVENEILDMKSYLENYVPRARDMIKTHGGRYLAAGDATTFAGEPPKSRVAIFVFDNLQQIRAWQESADYKELKAIGDKYANFRNYAVPGVPRQP